jgi:anthranilate phosphoribosyltransferase
VRTEPLNEKRSVLSSKSAPDAATRPDLRAAIAKVAAGGTLRDDEAADAFELMMSGAASPVQMAALLVALRVRGETVEEITGAARAMRARVLKVQAPEGAIDTCGTGGDGKGSYNISTCTAFVVAGAGVPVAKHGNRSISSRCGSADVLAALGIATDATPNTIARCLSTCGLGFMFAPAHHAAIRHVTEVRAALGTRTIFNLLGPLANPAGAKRQVIGVFAREWVEPLARVLGALGAEKAWVMHGSDGLDELTTTGPSDVAEVDRGAVRRFEVTPEDAGLARAIPSDLAGGDAASNAAAIEKVLAGARRPFRDVVLLNAAAALLVAGKAVDLRKGIELAAASIDTGKAAAVLAALRSLSHART